MTFTQIKQYTITIQRKKEQVCWLGWETFEFSRTTVMSVDLSKSCFEMSVCSIMSHNMNKRTHNFKQFWEGFGQFILERYYHFGSAITFASHLKLFGKEIRKIKVEEVRNLCLTIRNETHSSHLTTVLPVGQDVLVSGYVMKAPFIERYLD